MSTEPGYIRVSCTACKSADVWFKCNGCGLSDHFSRGEAHVSCSCGESYDSGVCTCGTDVPFAQLEAVGAKEGPISLADPASLEIAWGRVGVIVMAVLLVVSTVIFLLVGV